MMANPGRYVLVAVIAATIAVGVSWGARNLIANDHDHGGELHGFVHDQLDLDPAQMARVEELEARFAKRRTELEMRLKVANGELAQAMASEHEYGPRVAAAVDHSHMAMGELQKATLEHVFAMRALLRPDQSARFDQAVNKALTGTHGE